MTARTRLPFRLLASVFGVLLLAFLIRRSGPAKILESIAALGWGLSLVIALGGVSHLLKTWAWRLTLVDEKQHVSFTRMLGLRLGSEAVGQLGALGQVFGETLRVSLLSTTLPLASGIASVTLDRAFFILSATIVTTAGLVAALAVWPLPHLLSMYAALFISILSAVILLAALTLRRRWAVVSGTARTLGRVRYFGDWIECRRALIHSVEHKLLDFYHHTPGAFWGSFLFNLACHGLAICEVYVILRLMGAKVGFITALAVEGLTKLINLVGVFNPGNIGTYEGGNMLIGERLGLSGAAGLTLGLARRVRAIFWAAVGGVCLVLLSRWRKQTDSSSSVRAPENSTAARETPNKSGDAQVAHSHIAVILANNSTDSKGFGPQSPRVGALPVLLRVILGAKKAGATRIAIVVRGETRSSIVRDLQDTGRLPASLEWFELESGEVSFAPLLGHIAGGAEQNLVLISGDRTYHPSLHRRAAEWEGNRDSLALRTGGQLVGIYVLSQAAALDVANCSQTSIGSIEELDTWLTSTHSVETEQVDEGKWQRVSTLQDRLAAERKLDSWLVKPTDGIFARLNRRISIPISRQLIKFPITPNMVTLFTLAVSFIAGLFFALGGYRNMLLGAILSLFASILDGSDGEVARLKLQESDFGCWLETICDYLYYLFIFAGMTIGLMRRSSMRGYLVFGALLLVGAVLSFFVTGLQRRRLTNGRPEQLLGIWQAEAASRRNNIFLYFGRHTEFIVRRCFLPYALLFFAVLNITQVAFILAAFGANIVWIIALYSHRAFATVPTVAIPASLS